MFDETRSLAERLRSWAQNEEMIDAYFLAHGLDCLQAAEELERCYKARAEISKTLARMESILRRVS